VRYEIILYVNSYEYDDAKDDVTSHVTYTDIYISKKVPCIMELNNNDDNNIYIFGIYIEILFSGKNVCVVVICFLYKTVLMAPLKPQIIITLPFISCSVDATIYCRTECPTSYRTPAFL
jgi:hypothetical protein